MTPKELQGVFELNNRALALAAEIIAGDESLLADLLARLESDHTSRLESEKTLLQQRLGKIEDELKKKQEGKER